MVIELYDYMAVSTKWGVLIPRATVGVHIRAQIVGSSTVWCSLYARLHIS